MSNNLARVMRHSAFAALAMVFVVDGTAEANQIFVVDAAGTSIGTLSGGNFYGYVANCSVGMPTTVCAPATDLGKPDKTKDDIYSDAPFTLDVVGTLNATAFDYLVAVPPPGLDKGSNEINEAATLAAIAGIAPVTGDQTPGNGGDMSFSILTQYFSIKVGNQWAFFKNESGGALSLTWDAFAGEGAGLSHFTEIGDRAVPGPIVGAGLPSLVLLLGGLYALRRRERKSA